MAPHPPTKRAAPTRAAARMGVVDLVARRRRVVRPPCWARSPGRRSGGWAWRPIGGRGSSPVVGSIKGVDLPTVEDDLTLVVGAELDMGRVHCTAYRNPVVTEAGDEARLVPHRQCPPDEAGDLSPRWACGIDDGVDLVAVCASDRTMSAA